jgi:hypothetical protein
LARATLPEPVFDPAAVLTVIVKCMTRARGQREDVNGLERLGKRVDEGLAQCRFDRQGVDARLNLHEREQAGRRLQGPESGIGI